MKVIEFYDKSTEPLISFEIIPPKRGKSINGVFEALDQVMKYNPPFIDITSHAAEAYYEELEDGAVKRHIKRKRPGTIGLSAAIKHRYNVEPVPHIIWEFRMSWLFAGMIPELQNRRTKIAKQMSTP